jgi:hypothetical protein
VGFSDVSDFSGALLFVSTTKRGQVTWYDNVQEGTVAKSSVFGVNDTRDSLEQR